jgi:phenylpropionate dioxygenase-like ring-hydroxylating dioxygenase large terminal subunit
MAVWSVRFTAGVLPPDGACVEVPLSRLTEERRARMAAQAVPVREAGGLIWIYTGQNPTSEPPVPEALLQPGWSRFYYS